MLNGVSMLLCDLHGRWVLGALLLALGFSAPRLALAQEAPDQLVKRVSGEVLTIIEQDRELRSGTPSRMAQLIEEKIVP